MLRLMIGALLMTCCTVGAAHAADVYQWKGTDGITHFTDNAMSVPEKYRKSAKRNVNKLRVSGGSEGWGSKPKGLGERVWLAKCSSCHTMGGNSKNKLDLGPLAVNQKTKSPATIEEITPQLRLAANGGLAKMPRLNVTDKELKQIATFILGVK